MKKFYSVIGISVALSLLAGCSTAPRSQSARTMLKSEADRTIAEFKAADPARQKFFANSAAYAVFPDVAKAGWVLGGGYGRGIIYETGPNGALSIGYVDVTHANIGLQCGGQDFSEIIFLKTPEAVRNFKHGKMKLSASVSAAAPDAGVSKDADYAHNVTVFTFGRAGFMLETSLGGQKFAYRPM